MPKKRVHQAVDEISSGGGASPDAPAQARRASSRVRAAAETTYQQTPSAPPEIARVASQTAVGAEGAASNDPKVRAARKAGAMAGSAVRYVRNLEAEDLVAQLKSLVRRYPSVLAGAVILGFVTGRTLRGR